MKTIVGLYNDLATARRVVEDLANAGFNRQSISLITPDQAQEYSQYIGSSATEMRTESKEDSHIPEGAGAGAVIGGLGGLLVGLGALAIPGIGPIVAAGPLAAALVGAGVGAVAGGLIGALVDMGIPEEEANVYAEGVRQGRSMVAVAVQDAQIDQAVNIMERHNPIDIDRLADQWRASGWTGEVVGSGERTRKEWSTEERGINTGSALSGTRERSARTTTGDDTIKVVEEEVQVGKREVERGGVRVHSYVREVPVEEEVRLREERVSVERRPVDRPATGADLDAFQEKTIEMTETAEEAVVGKQARVVEEIAVRKDVDERVETVRDTARRTEVDVEPIGGSGRSTFESFDPTFRRHYDTTYGTRGRDYSYYQPAYRYGYTLASDPTYRNRSWSDVEPEFRSRWERDNQSAWDDVKDAVQNAWNQAKNAVSGR